LLRAPALGVPNYSQPFSLYLHINQNIAMGLLSQDYGHTPQLVHIYQNN
jgi:hypothetical protein